MALNKEQSAKLVFNSTLINAMLYLTDDIYNELIDTPKYKFGIKHNINRLTKAEEDFLRIIYESYVARNIPDEFVQLSNFGLELQNNFELKSMDERIELLIYLGIWVTVVFNSDIDEFKSYYFYDHYKIIIQSLNEFIKLMGVGLSDEKRKSFNAIINELINSSSGIFSIIKVQIPNDLL